MKTTLVKKLLRFIIPLFTIPILLIFVFYYAYLMNIVENNNKVVFENVLNHIEKTFAKSTDNKIDLSNHLVIKNTKLTIIDKELKIIADSNKELVDSYYSKHTQIIKEYIKVSLINKEDINIFHNSNMNFMIKPLLNSKNELIAFAIDDYDEFYKQQIATLKQTFIYILFIIIFAIFLSIVFTLIFAYQITYPINSLIEGTKIISKGNLAHHIPIYSDDEIGILVTSFNDMVEKLKFMDDELKVFNQNLQLDIKKEVEKNREKDKQLLQQSRLAQMGEMISMIAHQWRQPLAAISSTSASLELKSRLSTLDSETIIKQTKNISKYAQHLSSTIDDFRNFFKHDNVKKEISFDKVVKSSLGIVQLSLENKNITIIKDLNSKESFNTYPNELKQVVLNLLKNAEDILIEREIQNPTITIVTDKNTLSISDNGGGISQDVINKIFDPYFSTKLGKNGTGLGLYMSKTIIEEHCNGKLSVFSDENGALFKIVIGENYE